MEPVTPTAAAPQILVVDDTPASLRLLTDMLSAQGYQVRPALNGLLALRSVAAEAPDLILLDVKMPEMDGYEVCRRLKAHPHSSGIPVIFISALDESPDKVKGFNAGGVDYITKPFESAEVLARVATHLTLRRLQQRLESQNTRLEQEILRHERTGEELRRYQVHLEELIAERTANLQMTNEQLQQEVAASKRAETERARLVIAIEQSAEAVFVCDTDWIIQYVNPAFERMSGYDRNEILGQHARILESDAQDKTCYAKIRATLARGETWFGRLTDKRKDASLYEAEVTVSPVRDQDGTIVNYVSLHRDITHEVRLERELRQAQKMEAIGRLAGGIAHDFNNILTAVVGFTELALAKVAEDHPVRRHLDQIHRAGSRATDLVKQILTFSRRTEHERKPVQVAPVVREVLKLLRSSLPSTIEIRQDIATPSDGGIVLADPTQIHQVLLNLGTNAAHAMRGTGGVLAVKLAELEVDGGMVSRLPDLSVGPYVQLTVSDTGHGMDAAVMERIFDPYFTTKDVGEGTGMGLAMVRGIIESHGGAVSVYSELGEGTTFHVFLPRMQEEMAAKAGAVEALPTGTEHILFVDDERSLVVLGKEMLESLGYRVTTETNSVQALVRFRRQPEAFDLVITDMTMPTLTGQELAKELLAIRPGLPIILCTGFSELITEKQAKETGIGEFVMKPYVVGKLAKAIRNVLT